MRKIEIKNFFLCDRRTAESFINEEHRMTKKTLPHFLSFTFNSGEEIDIKKVSWIIDLLYQAMIIKNPIDKIMINIDKRNKNYLEINVG